MAGITLPAYDHMTIPMKSGKRPRGHQLPGGPLRFCFFRNASCAIKGNITHQTTQTVELDLAGENC